MKKRKIKSLEPCVMEFYDDSDAALFDLLLSRSIGQKMFFVKKIKKPAKTYKFMFWATEKVQEVIDKAWDKIVQAKWENAEDVLLAEETD